MQRCRAHDLRHTFMSFVMGLSVASRYRHINDLVYIYVILEGLSTAMLVYLQTSKQSFFGAHRPKIIAATRILRICYTFILIARPNGELAFPLITLTEFTWNVKGVWRLISRGSVLNLQVFGFQVHFAQHLRLHTISVAIMVAFVDRRCNIECIANENYYFPLFSAVAKFLVRVQWYCPWFLGDDFVLKNGNCRQTCGAVNVALITCFGFFIPTLVLMVTEESSRIRWACRRYRRSFIFPTISTMLFYSAFLLLMYVLMMYVVMSSIYALIAAFS